MIRPFTCFCAVLAGASGLYLYTEKHRTTLLNEQISQIVRFTDQSRERTSMLRAEWALLNQPDRLQKLSGQFLPQLHPLAPQQFVQLADAAGRLPPREEPKAAPTPDEIAPPPDAGATPPAAPGTDAQVGAVLASALPEKIVPDPAAPGEAAPAADDTSDDAPAATTLASAGGPAAIRLPSPPVRLATGRPHTQPAPVRMASARARIIDPTTTDPAAATDETAEPAAAAAGADTTTLAAATPAVPDGASVATPAPAIAMAAATRAKPHARPARPLLAETAHRPAAIHQTPAVTQVAYSRPAAVHTVAWHPQPAPVPTAAPAGFNSALGGSHATLPPPVPLGG